MESKIVNQLLLILIGGGVGSSCRYGLSNATYLWIGRSFPYGTLAVNVLGSFLMGFLTILLIERLNGQAPMLRALLLVGFLGGFTTFSSFSIETLNLLESGDIVKALLNMGISLCLCLIAVTIGAMLGRQV